MPALMGLRCFIVVVVNRACSSSNWSRDLYAQMVSELT